MTENSNPAGPSPSTNLVIGIRSQSETTTRKFPVGVLSKKREVNPPEWPTANARQFVAEVYTNSRYPDFVLLGYHQGQFRWWNGASWPILLQDDLYQQVSEFFDRAHYTKQDADGVERQFNFQPTKHKLDEILAALRAQVNWPGGFDLPYWSSNAAIAPREIIPMSNGLLWVTPRALLDPNPDFANAYNLPFAYDPDAPAPQRWLRFLDEVWDDDQESKDLLQEWCGYLLTADTSQHKALFMLGPKRSGKGTTGRVMEGLLGTHNIAATTSAALTTEFGLQPLLDKQLILISDARLDHRLPKALSERLLSITAGDPLYVNRKHITARTVRLPGRLVIMSNELPRLSDASDALASRFLILKMSKSFYDSPDPDLFERDLRPELGGILVWALEGLARLRERGSFVQPESSRHLIEEMARLGSPVKSFVDECCRLHPQLSISTGALYDAYRQWCVLAGLTPLDHPVFSRDLKTAYFGEVDDKRPRDGGTRQRVYTGIDLL